MWFRGSILSGNNNQRWKQNNWIDLKLFLGINNETDDIQWQIGKNNIKVYILDETKQKYFYDEQKVF